MHPRSIYNGYPDFQALGLKHPELSIYVLQDNKGRPRIDFKNKAALRALTRALLLEDFNLNVIFPEDCLIPTIPLRLNYILWLEDLLHLIPPSSGKGDTRVVVKGIDIGTGASTVYALMGARKNNWNMVGTESNVESVRFAVRNVEKNNLDALVRIQQVTNGSIYNDVLQGLEGSIFDFTMCNPPFFSSIEETDSCAKTKRKNRPKPSGAKSGIHSELVSTGGEGSFIQQMIHESKQYSNKVRIFTTMIGLKKDLKPSIHELKCVNVKHYTTTEFIQGKTMRWGLAWTFDENIKLILPPISPKAKKQDPLVMTFVNELSLLDLFAKIKKHLLELQMVILKEENTTLEVFAKTNTWSHERRKRRMQGRMDTNKDICPEKIICIDGFQSALNHSVSNSGYSKASEPSLGNGESSRESSSKANHVSGTGLHFNVAVICGRDEGKFVLDYLGGSFGREGLYQVLQYMKNLISRKP